MKKIEKLFVLMYHRLDKKKRIYPNGIKRRLDFGQVKLDTDILDLGGYLAYKTRKSYEECSSVLYPLVNNDYNPKLVLDIGANYGFISALCALKMPQAKVLAVEPSKKLIPYIEENFRLNNVKNYEIIKAICGKSDLNSYNFSINPTSSQDNRVLKPESNWSSETIGMTCIDTILKDIKPDESVYMKIDTQGYEENVLAGGEHFLGSNKKWLIKMEFAPMWLKSQKTDPHKFLTELTEKYDVAELPATIPYFTKSIDNLFDFKIEVNKVKEFVDYLIKVNVDDRGWCDLIIRSKQ